MNYQTTRASGAANRRLSKANPRHVGGTGQRVLRIAAETADVVAIGGVAQVKGKPPGVFRLLTAVETDGLVRYARGCAPERAAALEWHALGQAVRVTDDRRAVLAELAERGSDAMTVEETGETPFLLIGTVDEIAAQLLRNRERYGFTYYTVHAPYMEAFAPVIERVRPRGE